MKRYGVNDSLGNSYHSVESHISYVVLLQMRIFHWRFNLRIETQKEQKGATIEKGKG